MSQSSKGENSFYLKAKRNSQQECKDSIGQLSWRNDSRNILGQDNNSLSSKTTEDFKSEYLSQVGNGSWREWRVGLATGVIPSQRDWPGSKRQKQTILSPDRTQKDTISSPLSSNAESGLATTGRWVPWKDEDFAEAIDGALIDDYSLDNSLQKAPLQGSLGSESSLNSVFGKKHENSTIAAEGICDQIN